MLHCRGGFQGVEQRGKPRDSSFTRTSWVVVLLLPLFTAIIIFPQTLLPLPYPARNNRLGVFIRICDNVPHIAFNLVAQSLPTVPFFQGLY